jgi:hypothetical protein
MSPGRRASRGIRPRETGQPLQPPLCTTDAGRFSATQQIHADVVGVVVNRGELGSIVAQSLNGNSERSSLSRIDVELADEFAVFHEFHDLAGLVHIGVYGIAVASD